MINKTILITGGTGSFGTAFVEYLLKNFKFKKIIIFSRDELKQSELAKKKIFQKKNIRFFLGDIRDLSRLQSAFNDVDYVIHAAALKHVPIAEYNPTEFIKTNILGSQNVIEASLKSDSVKKVIALSTDKAVSPSNLYGATKLCADKLFISANNIVGKNNINFSVVRYGNVIASRGSVVPIFLEQKKKDLPFTITDKSMTRFSLTMDEAVRMVTWSLQNSQGGDIVIPKIKSYNILDIAKAIDPKRKIRIIGLRPGEKIYEELISKDETNDIYDIGKYYIIKSNLVFRNKNLKKIGKKVKLSNSYNSKENSFLSTSKLSQIIKNLFYAKNK